MMGSEGLIPESGKCVSNLLKLSRGLDPEEYFLPGFAGCHAYCISAPKTGTF